MTEKKTFSDDVVLKKNTVNNTELAVQDQEQNNKQVHNINPCFHSTVKDSNNKASIRK